MSQARRENETPQAPSGYELGNALAAGGLTVAEHVLMLVYLQHFYDWKRREIPAERQPSINDLLHRTPYTSRTTIREALFGLQSKGFLTRRPPEQYRAQTEHARTASVLHLPGSPYAEHVRAGQTGPDHVERRERWAAVVRGAVERKRTAAAAADGTPAWWEAPELVAVAVRELRELARGRQLADVDELAAEACRLILDGRAREKIADPAAYLRKSLRADPQRFLPVSTPPKSSPSSAPALPAGEAAAAAAEGARAARERLRSRPRLAPQMG